MPKSYYYLCKNLKKNTTQFALINIPKLRLLLIPEQDSNLSEQGQLVHEMRVNKINEGIAANDNLNDIELFLSPTLLIQIKWSRRFPHLLRILVVRRLIKDIA